LRDTEHITDDQSVRLSDDDSQHVTDDPTEGLSDDEFYALYLAQPGVVAEAKRHRAEEADRAKRRQVEVSRRIRANGRPTVCLPVRRPQGRTRVARRVRRTRSRARPPGRSSNEPGEPPQSRSEARPLGQLVRAPAARLWRHRGVRCAPPRMGRRQ